MTRLLVSVRDVAEARLALEAGVDLLDVKEPRQGSLGAAARSEIRQIAELVAGRVPVSAAFGELLEFRSDAALAALPLEFCKLGLAGCGEVTDWSDRWHTAWQALPSRATRVAVAYADWRGALAPAPIEILEASRAAGCRGLLVDTFDKRGGDLFAHLSESELRCLVQQAREAGLLIVLAGSLRAAAIERASQLAPDYIAVRGAVCRGDRTARLDLSLLIALVAQLRSAAALQQT